MQALSSYRPENGLNLQAALRSFEGQHHEQGLEARPLLSREGWLARFIWPDWPPELSEFLRGKIQQFHHQYSELHAIDEGSPGWHAVSRGWQSDPPSARKVAECFKARFPDRVMWARCDKNTRGTVEARCLIQQLRLVSLQLSWRNYVAYPPSPFANLSEEQDYRAAVKDVFEWARQRIQPVLDALRDRLNALYGERFRCLYVFGSYARPDAGIELPEDSDLDVALLLSDFESPYKELDRYGDMVSDLSLEHGLVISLVPVRESDYKEGRTNFTRVISEYAIPVK